MEFDEFEILLEGLQSVVDHALQVPIQHHPRQLQKKITDSLRPVLVDDCQRSVEVRNAMTAWINRSCLNLKMVKEGAPSHEVEHACSVADSLREELLTVANEALSRKERPSFEEGRGQIDQIELRSLVTWRNLSNALQAKAVTDGLILERAAPIISNTVYRRDVLRACSIPFEVFAGYTVLTNQTVLGITESYVVDQVTKAFTLQGKRGDPVIQPHQREEVFHVTVTKFLERSQPRGVNSVKMEVVADPISWNGMRWYWVQDQRSIAALARAKMGENKPMKDLSSRTKLWVTSRARPDETPRQKLKREEAERKKRFGSVQHKTTWGFAFSGKVK